MSKKNDGFIKDHGLSVRMFITGAALLSLYALIGIILSQLGVGYSLIIVLEFAMLFGQYWFSDKIAMMSVRARVVSPDEEPELHAMIDRLCQLANMPKPKVGVSDLDLPNAFATGRNPSHAAVVVTRGIRERLDAEELEAVLAHELSHVAHRDVAVMTIASGVGMLAGIMMRMAMWGAMLGGGGDDRDRSNAFFAEVLIWLVSMVVYAVSFLLTMALSRYRELAADRAGAILIGKPSALASALQKVTGDMARIPNQDLRRVENMNAFFFTPALAKGSVGALFSTHPPLQKRLDQLARLQREMNQ
ncbi:MAG: zinc metalloprotease HtpX [Acidobacteria bacterium]|nr:zinc metalloprotease HtpX [Acidobacteriota bacterium]